MFEWLLNHSKAMRQAARKALGPDVLIVVNTTREQADFWQKRLSKDGIKGSGTIAKENAVILSVSEDNWKGGAGNGLGTLNGFILAAGKAHTIGVLDLEGKADEKALVEAFLRYCKDKSVFMYHTAGKGSRISPLPASEINSKSNVKLPEMLPFDGEWKTITILEEGIKETSIYAHSRKNRLSVFWGDQIIVNEHSVDFDGIHHIEIFGRLMPLDKEIRSYGVLIPQEGGDCLQREKLSERQVRKILPEGVNDVYRSIGSFSVSLSFLEGLLNLEWEALLAQGRDANLIKSLNTDPDWWQPLTSTLEEYIYFMAKKGRDKERSKVQWQKMNNLWQVFSTSERFKLEKDTTGLFRKIGFKDLGEHAIWWDYGQNRHYFRNIKILTEDSAEGEAARYFFGIDPGKWVSKRCSISPDVVVENSVILDSKISSGRVKNCVIINSDIGSADLENSIVIESKVIELSLKSALSYNVVEKKISGRNGHIIVNVFHPKLGRIPMRTSIFRDAEADYKKGPAGKGAFVFDNPFTYKRIATLNKKVSIPDFIKTKEKYMKGLKNDEILYSVKLLAEELSKRRKIEIAEARKIIAHRMMLFGDVDLFTTEKYSEMFGVETSIAENELNFLASYEREKYDLYSDKFNSFAGIWSKKGKGSSNKEMEGNKVFSAMPCEKRKDVLEKAKALRFGTSGLRALVEEMTDMECYINTCGFIKFLEGIKEIDKTSGIAVGGDRRESTPRIMAAVKKAVEDSGYSVINCGLVPSPALAYFAAEKGIPSIMVTGSHVPADRNGIKFNKKSGEVLKSDEKAILEGVHEARKEEYSKEWKGSIFDEKFMFKEDVVLSGSSTEAIDLYLERYKKVFSVESLKDKKGDPLKVVLYQHSAVGRDILEDILKSLGADVIAIGRSDEFVPVDTEKISETSTVSKKMLMDWAKEYSPFAIVSTDGDSDRPLVTDENGKFIPGDKLGALVSVFLDPDFAAVPVSANDAVIHALPGKGVKVVQTKIGSPYVIKAMTDELKLTLGKARVVGWEVNGGYLTGSDWELNGETLKALPTRDAVLPIISTLILAAKGGKTINEIVRENLPKRETYADVIDNLTMGPDGNPLIPDYTTDLGKNIVETLSPKETEIIAAQFEGDKITVSYVDGGKKAVQNNTYPDLSGIKEKLEGYYKNEGFEDIAYINWVDGIKIEFTNGEVSHLRPSGNAPEFRNYSQAATEERAYEIVEKRKKIVPAILKDIVKGGE